MSRRTTALITAVRLSNPEEMMPGESLASVAGCTYTSAEVPIFEELKRDQRVQSDTHESVNIQKTCHADT